MNVIEKNSRSGNALICGRIDARTRVFGVIGKPVAQSLGPVMHNSAFSCTGYPGIYLAFEVDDLKSAMAGVRGLDIRGLSVTIPHKIRVVDFLDEIDDTAAEIGAVNTIINRSGRLCGYNTDAAGAVRALKKKTKLSGKKIAIIGAGGAARAVAFGVAKAGAEIYIANRTAKKGKALARDLTASFCHMDELLRLKPDILINTTPVGMYPDTTSMPISPLILYPDMVVMDIVYHPVDTKLLKTARQKGCITIDGVGMFVGQGAMQFELWTGMDAPVKDMDAVVRKTLERETQ